MVRANGCDSENFDIDRRRPSDHSVRPVIPVYLVRKSSFALSATARRWAHGLRSEWEETMRSPIHLVYLLRKSIHSQSKRLRTPMTAVQENKLVASSDSFMNGYYNIRKFLTTPVPFPLVQMSRTFVFLYIFTVPFVLLKDESSNLAHCLTVFVMTYGFMGLEITAIELDDPFGDDDNDFDNDAMAKTAFEDTYLALSDIDGPDWVDSLRLRVSHKYSGLSPRSARAFNISQPPLSSFQMQNRNQMDDIETEQSWLLSKIV